MNIWFSYVAVFFIFGLIGFNVIPPFSGSWFLLIFIAALNILIIWAHEYVSKIRNEQAGQDEAPQRPNPFKTKEPILHIARHEYDKTQIISVWHGRYVRFYENSGAGLKQVTVWVRDRHGNIVHKYGPPVSGLIHCDYISGGGLRAYSLIQFDDNSITDYPVIWYRLSGTRYMDYILDKDTLTGTCNFYHKNGNLRRTVRLINGLIQGSAKTYYEAGNIMYSVDYKDGRKDGSYSRYTPEATICETGSNSGGKLAGYIRNYYFNASVKTEKYYLNGILMFTINYDTTGTFRGQTFTPEFMASAADDEEINSFRRLADARDRLAKHNMYLLDAQSEHFPRLRAICSHSSSMVLKEFSCEEELICFVLDSGRFEAFAKEALLPRKKITVKHFNDKGKLVRFR